MPNDESKPIFSFGDVGDQWINQVVGPVTFAPTFASKLSVGGITIDLQTLEVEAPSLEAASEAGRVFVESVRGYLRPQWRPIDSAPKCGTNILILSLEYEDAYAGSITVGFWGSVDSLGGEQFDWLDWCRGIREDDFWHVIECPTHWMPLPEAPEGV